MGRRHPHPQPSRSHAPRLHAKAQVETPLETAVIAMQDQAAVAQAVVAVEGMEGAAAVVGAVMLAPDRRHAVRTAVVVARSGTELQRARHREAL